MLPDQNPKSKSLLGITELTLVATIKDGLIPALDTRSYATRAALVMKTLNTLRQSSREAEPTPLIKDAVDRIRAIHSFRLSILGVQRRQLMLSVTFDGGWEPYMRQIWRDLGPLLDLIFCNCEDYLTSHDHSYAEYIGWVRKVQVNTDFFYTAGAQTVNDQLFLRRKEQETIDGAPRAQPTGSLQSWQKEAIPAITALYRLSDMFPMSNPAMSNPDEGGLLQRAARRLLGLELFDQRKVLAQGVSLTPTEAAALAWYADIPGDPPDPPSTNPLSVSVAMLQGGILTDYERITHGCLFLVAFEDAQAAQKLLSYVAPRLTRAADQSATRTEPRLNIAFTFSGLLQAGLPDGLVARLPQEFREGMAARSGALGDWRDNHPLHWRLPQRTDVPNAGAGDRVELSTVHAVLQLQGSHEGDLTWLGDPLQERKHPLYLYATRLRVTLDQLKVRVLAVQPMQRLTPHPAPAKGHFEYVDGISQPVRGGKASTQYDESVEDGDLLLGFRNSLNDPPLTGPLWSHSSFLVVRKLKQDVKAFKDAVAAATALPPGGAGVDARALLMGRYPDGRNLETPPSIDNDFNYQNDPNGAVCPFQSHVRRANPRTPPKWRDDQKEVPRLMRRGMSYGPAYVGSNADEERGLVFMAYNASIAEQFEVIQSWLAGGNSASPDSWSGQRDPFLGIPLDDEPLDFLFRASNGTQIRVNRGAHPWVTLEWGMYLFVPSLPAIEELRRYAEAAATAMTVRNKATGTTDEDRQALEDRQNAQVSALAAKGAAMIRALQAKEQLDGFDAAKTQWKLALEDLGARASGATQALWTAIREQHGGVLRTPYGVLVGSKEGVLQVFSSTDLTANGYLERMTKSFGPIYLGLDKSQSDYVAKSTPINQAISAITRDEAFVSAYGHTVRAVTSFLTPPIAGVEVGVEVKDLVDKVLAALSLEYFGLPDGTFVKDGGWHGRADPPAMCPGHFHAPSRYIFQPQPAPPVAEVGERNGKEVLLPAVKKFVKNNRPAAIVPQSLPKITRVILSTFPTNDEEAASNLIGALMGFLPTVDGNLRAILYEWMNDRSLWDHQSKLITATGNRPTLWLKTVEDVLLDPMSATMQLRPVPELTWRRAVREHVLKGVKVFPGDTVVAGMVSAVHEDLLRDKRLPEGDPNGQRDLSPVFGGNRNAAPTGPTPPTHACPGYEMAMGVLLGTLAGLMLSARLRPTLSPVTLRLATRPAIPAAPTPAPSPPPGSGPNSPGAAPTAAPPSPNPN